MSHSVETLPQISIIFIHMGPIVILMTVSNDNANTIIILLSLYSCQLYTMPLIICRIDDGLGESE